MTDPGDMANTDANTDTQLPDAKPTTVNPTIGQEGESKITQQNEKDHARVMQTPDPRDER